MARLTLVLALTYAGVVQGFLHAQKAGGFVKSLEFQHRLRVCNAYPYAASLDVIRSKDKMTDSPMPYKSCQDFTSPLKSGDKLEFKVGDASAGTFAVNDLPQNDAVLLLVIHRHDQVSTAVSFESHVFANLQNPQVAIIDTYKGAAQSTPRIKDTKDAKHEVRSEELRYSSIVAVNPGIYKVELEGSDNKVKSTSQLVAVNRESYVVLRVGVESKSGPAYPQELVVYPNTDPSTLQGGAASRGLLAALFATVLGVMA